MRIAVTLMRLSQSSFLKQATLKFIYFFINFSIPEMMNSQSVYGWDLCSFGMLRSFDW